MFTQFIDNKTEKTTRFNTVPKDTVNSYAFIIISTYASETFLSISIDFQISSQFRNIYADDLLIVVKGLCRTNQAFGEELKKEKDYTEGWRHGVSKQKSLNWEFFFS